MADDVDWNALAARVQANFAATGRWFVDDVPPQPPPATGGVRFVFSANDGVVGFEPWISDGTAAGTRLLKDINAVSGRCGSGLVDFIALGGGRVAFGANDGVNGEGLWVTDGTEAGTALVEDISSGPFGGPSFLAALGDGRALFSAFDDERGAEIWVTDGTAAGTALIADIFPGVIEPGFPDGPRTPNSSFPFGGFALGGGRAVFVAQDGVSGLELWVSDGTADGTRLVEDINPGAASSLPRGFAPLGQGRALFSADDGTVGRELWVTDGTADGTRLVKDIRPGADDGAGSRGASGILGDGRVLFAGYDRTSGSELWVSDGTEAGTQLVKDIRPGAAEPVYLEGVLFDPGPFGGLTASSAFGTLGDGRVLFSAEDGVSGLELWITDGTEAGTRLVRDIRPGVESSLGIFNVEPFAALGDGRIVFRADDGTNGFELWVSDGTEAGTRLLEDIASGSADGSPAQFTALSDGRVVFSTGEPWITDGTPEGTYRIKEINPGDDAGGFFSLGFPAGFTEIFP